jgi:hypothetical protein
MGTGRRSAKENRSESATLKKRATDLRLGGLGGDAEVQANVGRTTPRRHGRGGGRERRGRGVVVVLCLIWEWPPAPGRAEKLRWR